MICADSADFNHRDAVVAAEAIANAFTQAILNSVRQVTAEYSFEATSVILSGHGAFAAKAALVLADMPGKQLDLVNEIGAAASRCAPAHALAVLAREAAGL
jgi:uncharacterized hydantoinase/oxoprolinase family protein